MDDKSARCSFCGKEARVIKGVTAATICVDCAALAMHMFALEGVMPEPVKHVGTVTAQEIDGQEPP